MVDALRPGIAYDHPLCVVIGVVRQSLNRDVVTRVHFELGFKELAEIAPMDGLRGSGKIVMVLLARLLGFRCSRHGRRDQRKAARTQSRGTTGGGKGSF